MTDPSQHLDAVHALFAREFDRGRSPGMAYAIVRDGEILHTGAFGTTSLDAETPPSVDTVQRIASMTKSFTAAAVLLLRDRGLLDLDAPAAAYVPELAGRRFDATSPEPTVRHLLTMSAGLLTDDPWGDRNEPMTHDELGEFLAGGFTLAAPPGTVFEYSNLGYAILGRAVDNLTGGPGGYRELVLAELAGPLALTATTYDAGSAGPALAVGHHKDSRGWHPEPQVGPGAFSSMGGLHSSLRDLARWVGGFTDAFRTPDAPHPLSAASRREMQQLHRFAGVGASLGLPPDSGRPAGPPLSAAATGYGLGLFVEHHSDHGQVVQHSGGYPGYGSHMRWHPETGLGVVGLANGTYAAPVGPCADALRLLVRAVREPSRPAVAATMPAVRAVGLRLAELDLDAPEPFADPALFTGNVEQDVPDAERKVQLQEALDKVGAARPIAEPVVHGRGLGYASWWLPAERGHYDLELKMSPEPSPRVQWLTVAPVPAPPEALVEHARAILASAPEWPAAVPLAEGVDPTPLRRALGVLVGLSPEPPLLVPQPLAGDGTTKAEFGVVTGGLWWRLSLTLADPGADGAGLGAVTLVPLPTEEHARLSRLRLGAP